MKGRNKDGLALDLSILYDSLMNRYDIENSKKLDHIDIKCTYTDIDGSGFLYQKYWHALRSETVCLDGFILQ